MLGKYDLRSQDKKAMDAAKERGGASYRGPRSPADVKKKREETFVYTPDWMRNEGAYRQELAEQERYLELLDVQIASAKRESDPDALINQYKAILSANRDNELALMNQRASNDLTAQEKMYERMGALAREQAQSWLNTNRQLASDSFGFRSQESKQQYEQEKDMQMSTIRENEGVESRRRDSERNSALAAFKRL